MNSIDKLVGSFENPIEVNDYESMINLDEGTIIKVKNVVGMVCGNIEYGNFDNRISLAYEDKNNVYVLNYSLKHFPEPIETTSYLKKAETSKGDLVLHYLRSYMKK